MCEVTGNPIRIYSQLSVVFLNLTRESLLSEMAEGPAGSQALLPYPMRSPLHGLSRVGTGMGVGAGVGI